MVSPSGSESLSRTPIITVPYWSKNTSSMVASGWSLTDRTTTVTVAVEVRPAASVMV